MHQKIDLYSMRGVGNGGVITDGLFFGVDSFNKKSFNGVMQSYNATESFASYSLSNLTRVSDSTQQPTLLTIGGDVSSAWNSYIRNFADNGGSMVLSMTGGSSTESHVINKSIYDSYYNYTILYNLTLNMVTMSYTCSATNSLYGSFDAIIIPGVDKSMIFNIYSGYIPPSYLYSNLTYSLTGGSGTESLAAYSAIYDGTDTYLTAYNTGLLSYFDHTSFQVVVPEISGLQYVDHTSFSYDYLQLDNTISHDNHGNRTYSLDNGVGFNNRDFTFDGVDDNINVGDIGTFSEFTLDMWFKSTSITDYKNLIDFNSGDTCLRIEQYTSPGYTHTWKNRTNNEATGVTRMSVNFNGLGDGFGIGGNCKGTLIEGEWYNLVAVCNSPGIVETQNECVSYWDGLVIGTVDGAFTAPKLPLIFNSGYLTWQNYISTGGGQLTLTFFSGTYSLTYSVTTAKYYDTNQTVLFPDANPGIGDTYSGIFNLGIYSGISCIQLNDNSTYSSTTYPWGALFDKYFAAWPSLTMSLYNGTYSETYIVDSVNYTAPYYYIYDSLLVGLVTGITNSPAVSYTASFPQIPEVDPNRTSPVLYNQVEGSVTASNVYSVYLNNERLVNWVGDFGFVGYASNMRIGDGYDYSSRRFQGSIPYVALYNRPLSSAEISSNYNTLKWRFNNEN